MSSTRKRMETISSLPLTSLEMKNGCDLLIDSGSDSFVAGKHAFIDEVISGITVTTQSFNDSEPPLPNLRIVNAIYAYNDPGSGQVFLLHANHSIYMGDAKKDSFACPNQMRTHGLHVDDRPTHFFPNDHDT